MHRFRILKLSLIVIVVTCMFCASFAYYKREHQAQFRETVSNSLNQNLDELLKKIPGSVIARMTVINTKDATKETYPRHTWSVIAARAAPGFIKGPGPMVKDMPLSTWKTWLDSLIDGRCQFVPVYNLADKPDRLRLEQMGIFNFDICPILDKKKNLLGAISVSWHTLDNDNPEKYFPIIQKVTNSVSDKVPLFIEFH